MATRKKRPEKRNRSGSPFRVWGDSSAKDGGANGTFHTIDKAVAYAEAEANRRKTSINITALRGPNRGDVVRVVRPASGMNEAPGNRRSTKSFRKLGAEHAQEQLDSDYFRNWVSDQLHEAKQMRRRDPSSVIPFDAKVIAGRMLQQLVWDTKRDLRIRDVVGRDTTEKEDQEFMEGFEATVESRATLDWLADEILAQRGHLTVIKETPVARESWQPGGARIMMESKVEYHHNRRQAWRTVNGKLIAPGAVDIAFEVHKKVRTREQWEAWWNRIDNHVPFREPATVMREGWQPGGTRIAMEGRPGTPQSEIRRGVRGVHRKTVDRAHLYVEAWLKENHVDRGYIPFILFAPGHYQPLPDKDFPQIFRTNHEAVTYAREQRNQWRRGDGDPKMFVRDTDGGDVWKSWVDGWMGAPGLKEPGKTSAMTDHFSKIAWDASAAAGRATTNADADALHHSAAARHWEAAGHQDLAGNKDFADEHRRAEREHMISSSNASQRGDAEHDHYDSKRESVAMQRILARAARHP